ARRRLHGRRPSRLPPRRAARPQVVRGVAHRAQRLLRRMRVEPALGRGRRAEDLHLRGNARRADGARSEGAHLPGQQGRLLRRAGGRPFAARGVQPMSDRTVFEEKSTKVSTVRPERLERLREICMALPEATEKETWGDPTWRVRDRIFAMQKGNQDGGRPSLWLKAAPGDQEVLLALDPNVF